MSAAASPIEALPGAGGESRAAHGRAVRLALVLLALSGAVASLCRSGLAWDGGYILFSTLHEQQPFITHARLTSNVMLWPIVALSAITDNLAVLSIAFTAVWAAVPCLALALCWLLLRSRRPDLIRWPALGICLVTLPGQFFFASEALAAAQLFWVVLMWICVGMPRRWLAGALALSVAVGLFHPAGGGLLVVGAAAVAVLVVRRPEFRAARSGCALALAAGGVLRIRAIERTGYEGDSFRWDVLRDHFDTAVRGAPLIALILLALTLAGFVLGARKPAGLLAGTGVGLAGVVLVIWAAQPTWWGSALNYRSWGPLISAGVMGFCALVTAGRAEPANVPARPFIVPMAAVYGVVIVLQSLLWRGELVRLADGLPQPDGCRHVSDMFSRTGLPVAHWSVRATGLLLENRAPSALVINGDVQCADFTGDQLPLAPYETTARTGWFDLNRVGR